MRAFQKRLLAGVSSLCLAVSALAVEAVFVPHEAQALSADCSGFSESIVRGDSSFTVPASGDFTFEAGEQITFNIIMPPGGGSVRIVFLGTDQQINATGSLTFTVPNTGPTASGSFTIIIDVTNNSEQVQISGVCAGAVGGGGAANDANASAVVVDAAVLDVLPGGQGGGLNDAFGVNLNRALFEEAFRRIPREPEPTLEEELEDEINGLDFELERLFGEATAIEETLSPPLVFGAIDQPEPLSDAQREALETRSDEINQEIIRVRDARDDAINRRDALRRSGNNFVPMSAQNVSAGEGTALGVLRNGFSHRADMADLRRAALAERMALGFGPDDDARPVEALPGLLGDERFNAWLQSSATFHRVHANGRDEDGVTAAVAGGFSYLFADNLEAGLVGRYARSQRDGALAETDLDMWSLGVFAQGLVGDGVVVRAVAAASYGDGSVILDPAATRGRGTFDVTALQAQLSASRRFTFGQWWIEPNSSLSVTHSVRQGYTASNGTVVPETRSTRLTASAGPTLGTSLAIADGGVLTPFIGGDVFLTALNQPDRNTPLASADTSVGFRLRAGTGLQLSAGADVSLNAAVSVFQQDAIDTTISARLRILFDG